MKILYTSVFLLLTTLCYCQQSRLFQNVNYRAKELKHRLNTAGDSLTLEGERTIYKVEIFNQNFEQTIMVDGSKVIIPLTDIPLGRFVVQASLDDKLIVLTLLRDHPMSGELHTDASKRKTSLFGPSPLTPRPKTSESEERVKAPRLVVLKENEANLSAYSTINDAKNVKLSTPKIASLNPSATGTNSNDSLIEEELKINETVNANPAHKIVQGYWIEYKTNASYGGGTVKRIGDQAVVDRMIAIITLDKKTIAGRHNQLTIWEVYDVAAFLKYKMKKKNDLSEEAECFNSKPFFKA